MLDKIRIVLSQTSHPGNIGAAARAMKNMGLTRLTLVAPQNFPNAVATERASGADDVLATAVVVASLEEAIQDCHWVYGTSSRQRAFAWPQLTPKVAATNILTQSKQEQEIAIVFGNERAGLANEELQQCDFHIAIPTHPGYASLNIAQAVQVITYEIYQHASDPSLAAATDLLAAIPSTDKATAQEITDLITHFQTTALALGFIDPKNPKNLMPRIKRLCRRAQLEKEEVNIIRGFFKAIQHPLKHIG